MPSRTEPFPDAPEAAEPAEAVVVPHTGPLTGKQRRKLRALGHHLPVLVQVGQHGVTDGVVKALEEALETHELVKIRIDDEKEGRATAIEALASKTGAHVAQVLGRTALLFKQRKKKSKIALG